MNPRRLYRSRDRRLAGVAGGMADYLDIDPTIVRILWIIAGFLSVGFAILAYIILAIVIPDAPWAPSQAGSAAAWGPTPQAPAPGWATPSGAWPQAPQGGAAPADWAPAGQAQGAPAASAWAGYPPAAPAPSPAAWGPAAGAQAGGWTQDASAPAHRAEGRGIGAAAIVGVALIVIGGIALLNVVVPGWVAPAALGPAILIAIGAAFVVSSVRRTSPDARPAVYAGPAAAPEATAAPSAATPTPEATAAPSAATPTQAAATEPGAELDETTSIAVPAAGVPVEDQRSDPV